MRVTSFDVAQAAGVSQSTVSRALSGSPLISASTIRKVREAAERLHYVPSDRARDLSTRTSRRIAMVLDLDNPLWSLLVSRTYDVLAEHQYRLSLVAEHGAPPDIASHLFGGSVDGVIVAAALLDSSLPEQLVQREMPTVLLHRFSESQEVDASVADDRRGGYLAARTLLDAGHDDIGVLAGSDRTSTGRERATGFLDALHEAGLEPRVVHHGAFSFDYGYDSVRRLHEEGSLPRALFCANDTVAIGAMNAARELGLEVPVDLALVGFDDLAESSWPLLQLTTIRVPFGAMLESAVSLLLDRIAGGPARPARRIVHPVEPVLRSTHLLG